MKHGRHVPGSHTDTRLILTIMHFLTCLSRAKAFLQRLDVYRGLTDRRDVRDDRERYGGGLSSPWRRNTQRAVSVSEIPGD